MRTRFEASLVQDGDDIPRAPSRVHYMDAMRGVLMSLGVLLHAAQIYRPEGRWLVRSQHGSETLRLLADFLATFRMPAFFMISGYFCLHTLRRHGPNRFLRTRSQRILLPLTAAALFINVPQKWLLAGRPNWTDFLATGEWRYHLWFLVNVMVYFAVAWALYRIVARRPRSAAAVGDTLERAPVAALICLGPLVSVGLLGINRIVRMDGIYLGMFQPYWLLHYALYFAFGFALHARPGLLKRFGAAGTLHAAALVALFAGREFLPAPATLPAKALDAYLGGVTTWLGCTCCFSFFVRFAGRPSTPLRFLSDASYTTYLFHHPLVVLGGLAVVRLDTPPWIGFPVVVLVAASLCLVLHETIVSRSRAVRLLFNGK